MPYIIGVNPFGTRSNPVIRKKKATKKKKPASRKKSPVRTKSNPVAKRTAATRSNLTMAKKSKARRKKSESPATRWRTKTVTKWRTRSRRAAYRVKRAAKSRTENLDIKKIVRGSIAAAAGMLIAKAAVNKLTPGGSETERWSWPNIAMAAGSSIAVAFALGAMFRFKKPTVAWIAVGGGALAAYKAFTCKLAPKWGWSESWFGAEDEIDPTYLGADEFDVVDYSPTPMGYIPGMGATMSPAPLVPYNPYMGATDGGGKVVQYNPNMGQVDLNPGRELAAYRGYTM